MRIVHIRFSYFHIVKMQRLLRCFCCFLFALIALSEKPVAFVASSKISNSVNYADVRARVAKSFPEKANEIANLIAVLQDLSKATVDLTKQISTHCQQ